MITIDKGIVSRWKIDTKFEHWLSHQADHSHFFKVLYCKYYAFFDKQYYETGIQMAKESMEMFHADKIFGRKYNEKEILYDMIYCLHRFGFSYDEYFWYKLYEKNATGKDEFISEKMRYEYYCKLNKDERSILLTDKGETYKLLGEYFKRDCVEVYTMDDFAIFRAFVSKHPQFIYKPSELCCGEGVKKIDSSDSDEEELCKDLLKNGPFVAEEIIIQSDDMAKLHPQTVNTVRLTTLVCRDGIYTPSSFMKMGRGDKTTADNARQGGIFAAVDPDTGVAVTKAVSEYGNDQYIFHPDTGEKIVGFQLPEWKQARQLVKKMALMVPNVKFIGWDLAHTDDGWVLVEANSRPQFVNQVADKIGMKHKFLKLMKKA